MTKQERIISMTEDEFDMIAKNTFDNEFTQDLIECIRSHPHVPVPVQEGDVFFDVTPDPAGYRIYINFYNAGTFSIELSKEQLERLQIQLWNILPSDKHDTAIHNATLDKVAEMAEHYYRAYLDGDPYLEQSDFKHIIDSFRTPNNKGEW